MPRSNETATPENPNKLTENARLRRLLAPALLSASLLGATAGSAQTPRAERYVKTVATKSADIPTAKAAKIQNNKDRLVREYSLFLDTQKSNSPFDINSPSQITDPEEFLNYALHDPICEPSEVARRVIVKRISRAKVSVALERSANVASSEAIFAKDEEGRMSFSNPNNIRYGFDCADLHELGFSFQAWSLKRNNRDKTWQWSKSRLVRSAKVQPWSPDYHEQGQQYTGQPNAIKADTLTMNIPVSTAKRVKLAVVADDSATIKSYRDRQVFILGPRIPQRIGVKRVIDLSIKNNNNVGAVTRPSGFPKR